MTGITGPAVPVKGCIPAMLRERACNPAPRRSGSAVSE
jgi:hypothetical protein